MVPSARRRAALSARRRLPAGRTRVPTPAERANVRQSALLERLTEPLIAPSKLLGTHITITAHTRCTATCFRSNSAMWMDISAETISILCFVYDALRSTHLLGDGLLLRLRGGERESLLGGLLRRLSCLSPLLLLLRLRRLGERCMSACVYTSCTLAHWKASQTDASRSTQNRWPSLLSLSVTSDFR